MMEILTYSDQYERSWIYTKALSHLFSPFFDDMSPEKEALDREVFDDEIDLIAVEAGQVIGLLRIAIYNSTYSQTYKYYPADKVAYFENLAVHPDFQNQGIAQALFEVAEKRLKAMSVDALSIFTRDGDVANHLYQKWGAQVVAQNYLVMGSLKNEPGFQFEVLHDQKRLCFSRDGRELPYYQREGVFVVAKAEDLSLFDIDKVYLETSYIKVYQK